MAGDSGPTRTGRPTLADVAARAGVSRTTVSNAYNRPDQLSVTQREHVLGVAAELGYSGPDPMARSLRTRSADAVGLVFSAQLSRAFTDPAAVEFLSGVAEACEVRNRSLLLIPAGPPLGVHTPGTTRPSNTAMVERAAVDGFLVYSLPAGDPHVDAVLSRPQAAIFVDSPDGVDGIDFVGIDDRVGFRAIAEHVLALGHERIGVVSMGGASMGASYDPSGSAPIAPPPWCGGAADERHSVYVERRLGLWDAIEAQGRSVDVSIYNGPTDPAAPGRTVTSELLDGPNPPTVIMCMSDALAIGVLGELAARGLRVPEDISVTGFDDVPDAAGRGLTTVSQPTRKKGRLAAEMLLDGIESGVSAPPRRTVLPTSLVVRSSTAAPAVTAAQPR